jgi:hypothetical protein
MRQRNDRKAWQQGHKDGWTGRPSQCPNGTDPLGYASGFAAGRTTRERGIASGIGLLNNGTVKRGRAGIAAEAANHHRWRRVQHLETRE